MNRLEPRFTNRFYGGQSAIDGGLSYNHPTSKFTSLYIVTSTEGGVNDQATVYGKWATGLCVVFKHPFFGFDLWNRRANPQFLEKHGKTIKYWLTCPYIPSRPGWLREYFWPVARWPQRSLWWLGRHQTGASWFVEHVCAPAPHELLVQCGVQACQRPSRGGLMTQKMPL